VNLFDLVVIFPGVVTDGLMILVVVTGGAFVVGLTVGLVVLVVVVTFFLNTIPAEADIAMMPREINDT
jgi:hypothetical protein